MGGGGGKGGEKYNPALNLKKGPLKSDRRGVGGGGGGRGRIETCLEANDRPGEKAEMYKKCQHYLTKVFTTLNFFLN